MTPELLTLISRRLTNPASADQLAQVHRVITAKSPVLGQRYARLLESSGALSNPETTPEERESLVAALPEMDAAAREDSIRIRLSGAEKERLLARAEDAGKTVSALIRDELCG